MKHLLIAALALTLSACSAPNFIADVPPLRVTTQTPERFELPARFAVARVVYNQVQPASTTEAGVWDDVTTRAAALGTFTPLLTSARSSGRAPFEGMLASAFQQRFDYLLVVDMDPDTGSADVSLLHVASGGLMATTQAVSPRGGARGFFGGDISNPARLDRVTLQIARATAPKVDELLQGVAARQR